MSEGKLMCMAVITKRNNILVIDKYGNRKSLFLTKEGKWQNDNERI